MRLIDTHCHLNYDYSPKTDADLVREAGLAEVVALVTIGTDLPTLPAVAQISDRYANVYHTVGVHPHDASTLDAAGVETLRRAARHPKCRAIGEIGLDYHYDHSPRDVQIHAFEAQAKLAIETGHPLVIHSRDGEEDLLRGLRSYCATLSQVRPEAIPGVIHCFTGTRDFGLACLDLGFYISFSGILTFKNAEALRACAQEFPLERLLVETDSPYLAPVPHRGKKCEPSMVRMTALKLAELKGVSLEEVAEKTTRNAARVFRLPLDESP